MNKSSSDNDNSDNSDSGDDGYIPPELLKAAAEAVEESLPEKSEKIYKDAYSQFLKWLEDKKTKSFSEPVLLAYFKELSTKMAPASLWPRYLMLRSMINQEKNINIANYMQLRKFLKKLNTGVKPKKAKTFTAQEIKRFLAEAPDDQYLDLKVVMFIGITGACTHQELHGMKINHVKDEKSHLVITIPDTKTHINRIFTVNNPLRGIVIEYIKLRPQNAGTHALFLNYQSGKCAKQTIGINKLGGMPQKIAAWLGLPSPMMYTGHSFRRTSASLLAYAGASLEVLKRHGGWRSSEIAESYVEQSIKNKRKICNKIIEGLVDEDCCDSAASSTIKKIKITENQSDDTQGNGASASTNSPSVTVKLDNCSVQ